MRILWTTCGAALVFAALLATSASTATTGANWRNTGPKPHVQIHFLVRSQSRLYAANHWGDVYRSDNGGSSWTKISPPSPGGAYTIEGLAADPTNPNILYVASWTPGIFSTADGGKTWTRTELCPDPSGNDPATWCDPQPNPVSVIAVDPTNPSIVYAGTRGGGGLYKSTGGPFVNMQATFTGDPTSIFVDPKKPNIVFVGIDMVGIFRSTNGGQTFAMAMKGIKTTVSGACCLKQVGDFVYDPLTKNLLVGMTTAVYRSTNDGASWVPSKKGLAFTGAATGGGALQQSPVNPKLLVYYGSRAPKTGEEVWGSADGGHSWKPLSTAGICCDSGGDTGTQDAMVFDRHSATTIYWASYEGVFKTVNGAGILRR